jgi:acyl carrier protein
VNGNLEQQVLRLIAEYGGLAVPIHSLAPKDCLFEVGFTSQGNINLMLALEEAFDIEFPESMLNFATFESIHAITLAVAELLTGSSREHGP